MEDAIHHAVSAQVDRPEIIMESGEVLLRSGRNFPAAVQYLRRYLALNSKVEEAPAFKAHYLLGTALEKQGDKQGQPRNIVLRFLWPAIFRALRKPWTGSTAEV